MQPNLAQVLNTLAHEIRTPLAVSQGYLKLYLDGRLTNVEDTRKAFEQTRQALGTLATLCVDMGKVSALSESASPLGVPERMTAADFVTSLRAAGDVASASWQEDAGDQVAAAATSSPAIIATSCKPWRSSRRPRSTRHATQPHVVKSEVGNELIVLAGTADSLPALQSGPEAAHARAVDFVKGGKGLKLIWAAFVLDIHRVHTWTHSEHRASVGFRIPLVQA